MTAITKSSAFSPDKLHELVTTQAQREYDVSAATRVRRTSVVTMGAGPVAKGERKTGTKGTVVAPSGNGGEQKVPGPLPPTLLAKGTFNAVLFTTAIRDAGKRPRRDTSDEIVRGANGQPIIVVDAIARREDEIVACSGFLGYTLPHEPGFQPHGVQLDNARNKARFIMTGGKALTTPYTRSSATIGGFVAGMPDTTRVLVLDLLKREELAAVALRAHEVASETVETEEACQFHVGRMMLERDRLKEIRKQLRGFGLDIPEMVSEQKLGSSEAEDDDHSCEDLDCQRCFEDISDTSEVILTAPIAEHVTMPTADILPPAGAYADETTDELYGSAEQAAAEAALAALETLPKADTVIEPEPLRVELKRAATFAGDLEEFKKAFAKVRAGQ